ncbi:MAG: DUF2812 domain-containing protein [Candidatus Methanoplasma sp.]|jgi:hypothetical protein|nr:DUF2812 domain-containing protein [Candidatus Methanoplasma sp.]
MKTVVWKWFIDYEKEEAWLNEMSAKGFAFTDYFLGRYTFKDSAPGEYIYRMEYLKKYPSHPESQQYLKFMAEAGAECVSSWFLWAYFRKKAENGTFDIYSDIDSRIAHYKRIGAFFLILGILEAVLGTLRLADVLSGETLMGLEMDLFLICFFLCMSAVFLYSWNSIRKKIKKLKKEKDVWE